MFDKDESIIKKEMNSKYTLLEIISIVENWVVEDIYRFNKYEPSDRECYTWNLDKIKTGLGMVEITIN